MQALYLTRNARGLPASARRYMRLKLQKREVILPESIEISIAFEDDTVVLHCSFRFAEEDERRELDVIIGAVSVEVVSE
jgi:hypothetical protein